MIYLVYGAGGMLLVLVLLFLGVFLGWKFKEACEKYGRKSETEEIGQEQRRQLLAQQQAFEEMLHYNQDTAYGVAAGLDAMQGGDDV